MKHVKTTGGVLPFIRVGSRSLPAMALRATLLAVFATASPCAAASIKVVFKHPNWNPRDTDVLGQDGKPLPKEPPAPPTEPVPPKAGEPNEEGEPKNAKLGNGDIPKAALKEFPWSSNGYPRGGFHKNNTGKTITEIVIKLEAPDEFDPASVTASNGFGNPMLSDDKRTLTFTGLDIKPCQGVWSMVPWSKEKVEGGFTKDVSQADRGTDTEAKGVYTGEVKEGTPQAPKPPKKEEPAKDADKSGDKKTNERGRSTAGEEQSQAEFDGLEHLFFSFAPIQYIEYAPGSPGGVLLEPTSGEDLIGAQVLLPSLELDGPVPEIPGAWRLKSQVIEIVHGTAICLNGALTNVLLVPDSTIPGYDSVIQGEIAWPVTDGAVSSRFIRRLSEDSAHLRQMQFFIRTGLLNATAGLTVPASTPIEYMWTTAQPEFTCPGDTNGDFVVDALDYLEMYEAFLNGVECFGCVVDVDGDGAVTMLDLFIMRGNWGECPKPPG